MLRQPVLCTFVLLSMTCVEAQHTEYGVECENQHEQLIEQFAPGNTAATDTFAGLDPVCAGWVLSLPEFPHGPFRT